MISTDYETYLQGIYKVYRVCIYRWTNHRAASRYIEIYVTIFKVEGTRGRGEYRGTLISRVESG